MTDHIDEYSAELEAAEIDISVKHEIFLDALREGRPTAEVDKFYADEQDAREALVKLQEQWKARQQANMEIMERDRKMALDGEIARSRMQVRKAANRFRRNVEKLARAAEIVEEAYNGLAKTANDVMDALHTSDRNKQVTEAYAKFRHNLIYAFRVQLAKHGVPTLPDTSSVRAQQKSVSPQTVVDNFAALVTRDG